MKFKVKFGVKNIEHVKFFRIMRAVLLFLFLGIGVSLASNSYSQETLFSISVNNKSVKDVFKQIENNSEFIIFYMDNTVDLNRKVNLDVKDQSVEAILNSIFRNTDNVFTIKDRQIIITKRETFPQPAEVNQQGTKVTGVITDTKGESIIGASVVEKGTTNGTTTDIDGRYELDLSGKNAVLSISYLGYATQEIRVDGRRNINIQLYEDSKALEEVVVVGYGTEKKVNVIGSIAQIGSEKLENRSTPQLSNVLTGQMAGVTVIQRSGRPGNSGGEIRVRGVGSFGGESNKSDALVLIDGIPGKLNDVSSEDVESISVLKDASTAAIYGSRAANGVILVTTKTGKEGKVSVGYNGYVGFNTPTALPEFVDTWQYATLYNEAVGREAYTQEEIQKFRDGSDPDHYANARYLDEVFSL